MLPPSEPSHSQSQLPFHHNGNSIEGRSEREELRNVVGEDPDDDDDEDYGLAQHAHCGSDLAAVGFYPFLVLGCLNNAIWVIMNSDAKDIEASGVAVVYIANIVPTLLVKLTGPSLWFHFVSYNLRVTICGATMILSLVMVAASKSVAWKLIGVALGSFSTGLGEPTLLALSVYYNSRATLSAFSAGTGVAGIFGYLWTIFFVNLLGLPTSVSLYLAVSLPVSWFGIYFVWLEKPGNVRLDAPGKRCCARREAHPFRSLDDAESRLSDDGGEDAASKANASIAAYSMRQRLCHFRSLWPFMIPLFTVYFAEYAMQSGAWAAIGFPVSSQEARNKFYTYSNFCYQIGVVISRSSGLCLSLNVVQLWILPLIQIALLVFFVLEGTYHLVQSEMLLLLLASVVGLIGGTVYVQAYLTISRNVQKDLREFSLAAVSVADTCGIFAANLAGLIIQGCIYGYNQIQDKGEIPVYTCGYTFNVTGS